MELLGVRFVNKRLLVQSIAAVVVLVFTVGIWSTGGVVKPAWLRFFSVSVFIALALLAVWDKWLWRFALVEALRGVPRDISGTWKGTVTSFWTDPATREAAPPKPAFLVVRQTASTISIVLLTDESRSVSSVSAVSEADGMASLDYLYLGTPDSRYEHRSRMHRGSASLNITGRPATRLRGRYWTDRDSKGELDFAARASRIADDYQEAASLFSSPAGLDE